MRRTPRRRLTQLLGAAMLLLAALQIISGSAPASAATAGVVTVQAWPVVAQLPLSLDGQVRYTDAAGRADFFTADLSGARNRVRLVNGDVSPGTRVTLLSVVADPHHENGRRLLEAKLAVAHPIALSLVDRLGAPVPARAVKSMSLRSSDGLAQTARLPADGSALWLDQQVADRRPGAAFYATRTLSWTVTGVRVGNVSVAVGKVPPLDPSATSWHVPLAGYPFNVSVSLVPPVEGVHLRLGELTAVTDAQGSATLYTTDLEAAGKITLVSGDAGPSRRVSVVRISHDANHLRGTRSLVLAVDVQAAVRIRFVDPAGEAVAVPAVDSIVLGARGRTFRLTAKDLQAPIWLPASRLTQSSPPKAKVVTYTIDDAEALGTNAVFAGTQRFDPSVQPTWTIQLRLYQVKVRAKDLLFGYDSGGSVQLRAPDGSGHRATLKGGSVDLGLFPRGEYEVAVASGVHRLALPIRVAGDQVVPVRVISWPDVFAVTGLGLGLAVAVNRLGSRARRRRLQSHRVPPQQVGRALETPVAAAVVVLVLAGSLLAGSVPGTARAAGICPAPTLSTVVPAVAPSEAFPLPVWSYYYIWYTTSSWRRAKIDSPQLGCYSSDDTQVMRAHVRLAKAAGITGFLVSWKHTPVLDARLRSLTAIAASEQFSLGIVYQALDFRRHPLPAATVRRDLIWLASTYGMNPVFTSGGKPTVVWTGTEQYPVSVIEPVVASVRRTLSVYSSAKSVRDYLRVAKAVAGNAYYWSSADPTLAQFATKLAALGAAVHSQGGRWLAPAAPGFDGRPLGGARTIERHDGAALRTSVAAALASAPDALGVISWNEWSENTYIEPSARFGRTDLAALASVLHGTIPTLSELDSSQDRPNQGGWRSWYSALVLAGLCLLAIALVEHRRQAPGRALHREVRDSLPLLTAALNSAREDRGRPS